MDVLAVACFMEGVPFFQRAECRCVVTDVSGRLARRLDGIQICWAIISLVFRFRILGIILPGKFFAPENWELPIIFSRGELLHGVGVYILIDGARMLANGIGKNSIAGSGSLNWWDRWYLITQLAVYTTYIPLIYCLLGGLYPTYHPLREPGNSIETWPGRWRAHIPCPSMAYMILFWFDQILAIWCCQNIPKDRKQPKFKTHTYFT